MCIRDSAYIEQLRKRGGANGRAIEEAGEHGKEGKGPCVMVSPRSGKILVAFYTDFLPRGNFIIWAQNWLAAQQMLRGRVHIS